MGLTETSDDAVRTLRGSIKLADRASRLAPSVSFTISVSNGAVIGRADEIYCDSPRIRVDFQALGESVIMRFYDFCSFEVETAGQQEIDAGCSTSPLTDIAERYREADLEFIWWKKRPIFDHEGTLTVYSEPGKLLYELRGGKLHDVTGSYDHESEAFVLTARRLEGFVLSDRELAPDAPIIPEPNPPTGT